MTVTSRLRLLLDNNVWSAIALEGTGRSLEEIADRHNCELIVPPSVLLEVLKTPQRATRDRIVRLLARGPRRRRLQTEAHLQSLEYVNVIRRRRPKMIRPLPDTGAVASLDAWWLKRIYRHAVEQSDLAHEWAVQTEPVINSVMLNQQDNRQRFVDSGLVGDDLTTLLVSNPASHKEPDWGGWDGRPIAAWRLETRDQLAHSLLSLRARGALGGPKNTFADWVGAYVDLDRLAGDLPGFSRLWLEEVESGEVLRSWLRRTLEVVQLRRKVTHGNPVDNQHAAYLPDCDVFITRDKAYAAVLGEVAAAAPRAVGQVRLLRHDASRRVVDVLDREISNAAGST